ncbi:FAD-binding protein [uncultured Thiodictyon sp.]|uniref:L-aspartate oxidase n=1 Tax=uncultured Thiodictyon sp. TaxID=1846217 RepID=UPI0025D6C692|nr:FAD-binding protein [uncultured Thiodictyon sp.]
MSGHPPALRRQTADLLILGAGGAGLLAALHAHTADPGLDIAVVCKGLLGKSGCTRMVQGGYNVALAAGDSVERHFLDTLESGQWLPDQELAWTLASTAPRRVLELENRWGCFFDRNPDGSLHQKAFAGQTFDRTVHKGDLTGIEIMNRLAEQTWARPIRRLEEHRAVALIPDARHERLSGALLLDVRSGDFLFVAARAVLLATGGGPTMYRFHTPSGDKSCDGLALALGAGLALRDMEMVQFHPTGLLAGAETRMNGTVLEEGLRGAGGWLKNAAGERFMLHWDPRAERATRDIVSRAIFDEIRAGRGTPNGGVYLEIAHLGRAQVSRQFKGMVERCADCGFDLAGGRVEVVPSAHYLMGGLCFDPHGRTALTGLYAAGEDTGGVHGANRLGGNGVANSTVFGGIAGDTAAADLAAGLGPVAPDGELLREFIARCLAPLRRPAADREAVRDDLAQLMWDEVGIFRHQAGLERGLSGLRELEERLGHCGAGGGSGAYHLGWHTWLDLANLITVSRAITTAALARTASLGAHWREDGAAPPPPAEAAFTTITAVGDGPLRADWNRVNFSRVRPGTSLEQIHAP